MKNAFAIGYMVFLLIFVMYAGYRTVRNHRRLNELEKQINGLYGAELELSKKTSENLELADKNRQLQKSCESLIVTNKKLHETIDRLIRERERLLAAIPNR